jgi:glutamyl-tRNA reductase
MEYDLLVIGLNHRTAPVHVRERLAFGDERLDEGNRRLYATEGIDEAAIVSTCNRIEVLVASSDPDRAVEQVTRFLEEENADPSISLAPHLYKHRGRDAVRHVFRVASSLDSMVVGEPQILGQLKEAYARAASVGSTGTVLHRCFHKAFSVAKRVRTETGIASRAVSVSSAAVELASKIFDHLQGKTAMLIGAGEMGELAARHLMAHGVGGMIVANRTFDRALELAREFQATPVPFDEFTRYLHMADIVIGCTAANDFILTVGAAQAALREKKGRPIFCIDLGVPRNFDPAINELSNAYLYDVDDLSAVAEENLGERAHEAEKAELIVNREVEVFCRWLSHLAVVPTIVALREKVETIRLGELQKALNALGELTTEERKVIETLTSGIVNKILHTPFTRLKGLNHKSEAFYVDATRRLFDLDGTEES